MSDLEDLFPPTPGGKVDTARKQKEADQAQLAGTPEQDYDGSTYDPVKVQLRVPEVASAATIVVATGDSRGGVWRLVGQDGTRYFAVVMTLDEPVVLCFSQPSALDPRNATNAAGQSAGGFVLPVNVPVPVQSASEIWIAATSATASRVSFYRQSFSE